MNRVEMLARARSGRMAPLQVTSVEAPAGQPVAGTPTVFAALFGIGYAVAQAFGPSEVRDALAYAEVTGESLLTAEELVSLRQASLS